MRISLNLLFFLFELSRCTKLKSPNIYKLFRSGIMFYYLHEPMTYVRV